MGVSSCWYNRLKNEFFNREFVLTLAAPDTNIAKIWKHGGLGWINPYCGFDRDVSSGLDGARQDADRLERLCM